MYAEPSAVRDICRQRAYRRRAYAGQVSERSYCPPSGVNMKTVMIADAVYQQTTECKA